MQFNTPEMNTLLYHQRSGPPGPATAGGDNFVIEERVTPARQKDYEHLAGTNIDLENGHETYLEEFIRVSSKDIPASFQSTPSLTAPGAQEDTLVRLEDITDLARDRDVDLQVQAQELEAWLAEGRPAGYLADSLQTLFETWQFNRDGRPAFVAYHADIAKDLNRKNWAERLCRRLGLFHYQCPGSHRLVLCLKYPANAPRQRRPDAPHHFVAPTVLDHSISGYFVPSPRPIADQGRPGYALDLAGTTAPVREILHPAIAYQLTDIHKVALLSDWSVYSDLTTRRAEHIGWLRQTSGRTVDFAAMEAGE